PPHRILQDQQLGTIESGDLRRDDVRQCADLGGVALLDLRIESPRLLVLVIVTRALAGIEAHGVEIRHRNAPALRSQVVAGLAREMRIEGPRLRMSENDMSMHGKDAS